MIRHHYVSSILIVLFICAGCAETFVQEPAEEMGFDPGNAANPSAPAPSQSGTPSDAFGSANSTDSTNPVDPAMNPNTRNPANSNATDPVNPVDPVEPPVDSNHRERPTQPVSTVFNDDQVNWTGLSAYPYDWIEIMNPPANPVASIEIPRALRSAEAKEAAQAAQE